MKNLKLFFILLFLVLLNNCTGLDQAMSGKNSKNSDEFLVKKKDPLILPPDHKKIPEPGSIANDKKSDTQRIKKILKAPENKSTGVNKSSSVEKSILEKIRQ